MGLTGRGALAATLISRGWNGETPAAIVCGASTPNAWVWTGPLAELGNTEPPAGVAGVMVVGEVVRLREALSASGTRDRAADEVKYGRS
jgi:siroheme synthase